MERSLNIYEVEREEIYKNFYYIKGNKYYSTFSDKCFSIKLLLFTYINMQCLKRYGRTPSQLYHLINKDSNYVH